jgi:predicted dinucleotide-binding enzyme
MANKVAVLGSGIVGEVLANGFLKHGYSVMRASRDVGKLAAWKGKAGANAQVSDFTAACGWGEIVVIAVKGTAAEGLVKETAGSLAGKTVIDATNPIADAAPDHGVLKYFTTFDESLMERLQNAAPDAHFVKAFNSVANTRMINPEFAGGVRPTMFICGDDAGAKRETTAILDKFGWETADFGGRQSARAIEPLCMLYCIRGLTANQWTHAFKLLEK